MCVSTIQKYGANPASIQWKVVRGDTAYDPNGDVLDELVVASEGHSVTITAPASLTLNWGSKYKSVVAELPFDLQVNIPTAGENTIWTPIIGTITVIGDVSPGGSL